MCVVYVCMCRFVLGYVCVWGVGFCEYVVCVCVCVCVVYVYISVYVYVCMCVCMGAWVCVCMRVCVFLCVGRVVRDVSFI